MRSEGLRHFIGRLICAGVRARTGSAISTGVRAGGVSVLLEDPDPLAETELEPDLDEITEIY